MILKFKEYTKMFDNVPYDTYNGPNITTWSKDNRNYISNDRVDGASDGQIGGEWYKDPGPSSKGEIFDDSWKEYLNNPIINQNNKRKKAIDKIKNLLKVKLDKKL
jgi:hypothetical protein